MPRRWLVCLVALWSVTLSFIGLGADAPAPYVWALPKGFPRPRVPASNPMSEAKAELGRHLFYDTRLSGNGDNPGKSPTVRGFPLSVEQRDDLIAFLRALTDEPLLHDRRFANPWKTGASAY
jgi:hypothetical protein